MDRDDEVKMLMQMGDADGFRSSLSRMPVCILRFFAILQFCRHGRSWTGRSQMKVTSLDLMHRRRFSRRTSPQASIKHRASSIRQDLSLTLEYCSSYQAKDRDIGNTETQQMQMILLRSMSYKARLSRLLTIGTYLSTSYNSSIHSLIHPFISFIHLIASAACYGCSHTMPTKAILDSQISPVASESSLNGYNYGRCGRWI